MSETNNNDFFTPPVSPITNPSALNTPISQINQSNINTPLSNRSMNTNEFYNLDPFSDPILRDNLIQANTTKTIKEMSEIFVNRLNNNIFEKNSTDIGVKIATNSQENAAEYIQTLINDNFVDFVNYFIMIVLPTLKQNNNSLTKIQSLFSNVFKDFIEPQQNAFYMPLDFKEMLYELRDIGILRIQETFNNISGGKNKKKRIRQYGKGCTYSSCLLIDSSSDSSSNDEEIMEYRRQRYRRRNSLIPPPTRARQLSRQNLQSRRNIEARREARRIMESTRNLQSKKKLHSRMHNKIRRKAGGSKSKKKLKTKKKYRKTIKKH